MGKECSQTEMCDWFYHQAIFQGRVLAWGKSFAKWRLQIAMCNIAKQGSINQTLFLNCPFKTNSYCNCKQIVWACWACWGGMTWCSYLGSPSIRASEKPSSEVIPSMEKALVEEARVVRARTHPPNNVILQKWRNFTSRISDLTEEPCQENTGPWAREVHPNKTMIPKCKIGTKL